MEGAGEDDKVILYTDYMGVLMGSVTDIIDMISLVLIAFVSISLVVSSIMIGIITYISVLERTKEIGILRAIGASKGDVSRVFNAETFIIGLAAGVLGIGITMLLNIPMNIVIEQLSGVQSMAAVPSGCGCHSHCDLCGLDVSRRHHSQPHGFEERPRDGIEDRVRNVSVVMIAQP